MNFLDRSIFNNFPSRLFLVSFPLAFPFPRFISSCPSIPPVSYISEGKYRYSNIGMGNIASEMAPNKLPNPCVPNVLYIANISII